MIQRSKISRQKFEEILDKNDKKLETIEKYSCDERINIKLNILLVQLQTNLFMKISRNF